MQQSQSYLYNLNMNILGQISAKVNVTRMSDSWPNKNMNILVKEYFNKYKYRIEETKNRKQNQGGFTHLLQY